jgi:GT2 family glycosyltransferase
MIADGEVMLGYIHNGVVRAEFMQSVMLLQGSPARRLIGRLSATSGGTLVSYARNRLAEEFLQSPQQWLFMADTDMVFTPGHVEALAAAADPVERPVVCAAVAIMNNEGTAAVPNLYTAVRDEAGAVARFEQWPEVPAGGVARVDGCGAGFIMIHRSVLEKMAPGEWFREGVTASGGIRGEDLAFCVRAMDAGFSIWAACAVRPGHMKTACITVD